MNKELLKRILPIIIFILFLIPVVSSSLLDLEQKKANEIIEQRIKAEQLALKNAENKVYLMGKFDPAVKDDFVLIPEIYATVKNKMYLRKETLDAFLLMANAAEKEEVDLKIASATRNFIYQKNLWNNKWDGVTIIDGKNLSTSIPDGLERFKKILEYSATPGTSRHHWGTDLDINDANPQYFNSKEGEKVYAWLIKNAPIFGFCQPYNKKDNARPTGYNEEKWHWSYLPLAKNFTQEYKNLITDTDINNFLGDEYVPELDLLNNYVLGINPECL